MLVVLTLTSNCAAADATPLEWLHTLEAGRRDAQLKKRPIFVRFGAEYCPWCRRLDEEIAKPAAQKALKRWTLIEIDTQKNPADARALDVDGIPAMRVVLPTGQLVESIDGYLPEEELIEWLDKAFEKTVSVPQDFLFGSDPPTTTDLKKILEQFDQRDFAVREAAIRRLMPFPKEAGKAVVAVFKQEKLAARLAAYELLQEWKAPLEEMDPWRQESMTVERYARIDDWLVSVGGLSPAPTLPEEELPAIRDEINRLLTADEISAPAIRERLARYKTALLPEIISQLKNATQDDSRSRLVALRYRVVMQDSLAIEFPGLVDRLAAIDVKTRQQAVLQLSENATSETQPLFLELFTDPDPRIRELSLLGLRSAAGDAGTGALAKLLDDPEPNVRSAVLKIFAEDPSPGLRVRLAEYLKTEQDPDLIVHAVRCFRKLNNRSSEDLLPLLKHQDWRVRAEVLDTLTGNWQRYPDQETKDILAEEDVRTAIKESLDDTDPFVVSRAMLGVRNILTTETIKKLIAIPLKHPALAKDVIHIISTATGHDEIVLKALRDFYHNSDPDVRAAAIEGMGQVSPNAIEAELMAALQDGSTEVRVAGAKTLLNVMKRMQPSKALLAQRAISSVSQRGGTVGEITIQESQLKVSDDSDSPEKTETPAQSATEDADDQATKSEDTTGKPIKKLGKGLLGVLGSLFGGSRDSIVQETPEEAAESDDTDDSEGIGLERDLWLKEFRNGQKRKEWLNAAFPLLEKMLASPSQDEQLASAAPLVALGLQAKVLPRILEIANTDGANIETVFGVFAWLPFEERVEFVNQLMRLSAAREFESDLLNAISELNDIRDSEFMWRLADNPRTDPSFVSTIEQSLKKLYFADNSWSITQSTPTRKKLVEETAMAQLSLPRGWNHIIALTLLQELSLENGEGTGEQFLEAVKSIETDQTLDADLRSDAFQLSLVFSDPAERNERLLRQVVDGDESQKLMALQGLLGMNGGLSRLSKSQIDIVDHRNRFVANNPGEPIQPEPPKGLTEEHVRPLLLSKDPELRALAGYVLAISDDEAGLPFLLDYWRKLHQKDNHEWDRLVYRAIASLDDRTQMPVLKQIYNRLDTWRTSEFYWTIRIMTGPEMLEFRKQIRTEKGQHLRHNGAGF